ncbi:MAG: TolC family protein [Bacteroidia bacterium]|nr:TolC family protein [Bacteroidia bacterium]
MSNKSEILKDIAGNESEIKLLLNYRNKEYLVAQLNDSSSAALPPVETIIFDSIEQTAFVSRYDLQMAALEAELGKNELQLAKKEAIPDVNFGAQYDKFGTYNNGYMGLLIGLPLPLWNLNQGNVKAAKARYDQLTLARQKKELEVHVSLEEVYRSLLTEGQLYRAVSKDFQKSSDDIYKNIYESYKNRTIGLIEFLEYFESYKNTTFNFIEIETDFRIQLQRLNLELGKDIY